MKKLLFTLSLCGLFFMGNSAIVTAQTKADKKEQKADERKLKQVEAAQKNVSRIEGLNFSFYPNTIEPEFGITQELMGGGDYYFTVDKNVLYMNLPYLGRFYITPTSPESVPINLTSSKFLYAVHTTDEINFHVTVIPSDLINILNQGIVFNFYINKNTGYAKLVVTADERQQITYTGTFN